MEKMSLFQLIVGTIVHTVIYVTALFTIHYSLGDRMDKNLLAIGEGGRRIIFFGVPAILFAALMCDGDIMVHTVGEKAYPYVLYGAMMVFAVAGMILYNIVPKRWVLPLGIAGWVTTFSWTLWYFWFGPGAFGHHHGF